MVEYLIDIKVACLVIAMFVIGGAIVCSIALF
jgi:hypothetical protein